MPESKAQDEPLSMLKYMMQESNMFSGRTGVSLVMERALRFLDPERTPTIKQEPHIRKLADHFKVSPFALLKELNHDSPPY